MARVDYLDEDSPGVDRAALDALKSRRGGRLLNLDRLLLHSPPLAQGWNGYMGAVRGGLQLDARLRELVILLVAVLNRAPYEFAQHAPLARAAGLTPVQLDALGTWRDAPAFDARDRAVLGYAEAMTLQVQVPQPVFDAVRAYLSARELVELTATVASYNMVSRFLEALQIEIEG